jgi:hypothetical protein
LQHLSENTNPEACCSHHSDCHEKPFGRASLSLDEEHDHCFICEYEFVSFSLPESFYVQTVIPFELKEFQVQLSDNVPVQYPHLPSLRAPPAG